MIKELKNKKILVLGGNPYADVIGDFCNKNGIIIHSMSNDKDAAIHKVAQKNSFQSSADKDAVISYIKKEQIDGVYMGGNETVITKICGALNSFGINCYCTEKQWNLFQNKARFKEMCKQYGLPVVERYDYTPDNKCSICFPVITKPSDGCGSSGFSICNDYDELENGYNFAKSCSNNGEVIVEKYVKNEGHVVFYSFSNGKPYFCLLQDKYPFRFKQNGSFVAGAHIFKSNFTDEFVRLFDKKLKNMFKAIGLKEGTLWIEVFHDGDNYYFNESGYRYGGSISIYPIDYFMGVNQVASDIYFSLTGKGKLFGFDTMISDNVVKNKKYYCMYPIYLRPGTISVISGFEKLEKFNFIVKNIIKRKVGYCIKDTGDFSQNFGYVHFVYDTKDEFLDIITLINSTVEIRDEFGNNMIFEHEQSFFDNIKAN